MLNKSNVFDVTHFYCSGNKKNSIFSKNDIQVQFVFVHQTELFKKCIIKKVLILPNEGPFE